MSEGYKKCLNYLHFVRNRLQSEGKLNTTVTIEGHDWDNCFIDSSEYTTENVIDSLIQFIKKHYNEPKTNDELIQELSDVLGDTKLYLVVDEEVGEDEE